MQPVLDSLRHRGPYGSGVITWKTDSQLCFVEPAVPYVSAIAARFHTRLSVIDVAAAYVG